MKKIKSIQLKAAFLLMVFSMNTIIGFACAMGLNMGFNSHHHEEEESIVAESSHHQNKLKHHHGEVVKDHHPSKDEDNCCHDKVMKIVQLDKAIPGSLSIAVNPIFFASFLSSFYIDLLYSSGVNKNIKYFVRGHHPPIRDVRIAIQSFQI